MSQQMLDFVGKPLEVGDDVVFTSYNEKGLERGKIIGFSKTFTMAIIEYDRNNWIREVKKTSGYVMKVTK